LSDALLLFSLGFLSLGLNLGGNTYFVGFPDAFCDSFLIPSSDFSKFLFSLFNGLKIPIFHLGLNLLGLWCKTNETAVGRWFILESAGLADPFSFFHSVL
jgi:hypothetical protein